MSQTNAPAGSEWVDQFNRAVQFGQINVDPLGLPKHASTHATGGSDAVSPASIGAASTSHAATHASAGSDPITAVSIGALPTPLILAGYSFSATGNTTSDVVQATYTFPGGCLGANGTLEGNIWATCSAGVNAKRIRAFISNTNNGTAGTRFVNFSITAQSTTAVVGMRGFLLFNRSAQNSQIIQPSASGGTGSTTSGFAFEELSIDTSQTFYITVALQKDLGTDSFQTKLVRLVATYSA